MLHLQMAIQTAFIVYSNWNAEVKSSSFGSFAMAHDLFFSRLVPKDVNHIRFPI
jgi:hypothetical protein